MNNKKDKLDLSKLPESVSTHIKQLERMRSDFVANVSHELRTPLTVFRGYLETFINKNEKTLQPYHQIFEQMLQHSSRMENIIDDLLLLSKLESEEQLAKDSTAVNVALLLEDLCKEAIIYSANKQHKIDLKAEKNLVLYGSTEDLKSLFSNLIINAVKYTPKNGTILVQWCQHNNYAVFSVTDTGIGIAPEHIHRITERFYRVDKARSRDSGGTGLGLAIVKHALMNYNGKLKIQSELGKGSTFTCQFHLD